MVGNPRGVPWSSHRCGDSLLGSGEPCAGGGADRLPRKRSDDSEDGKSSVHEGCDKLQGDGGTLRLPRTSCTMDCGEAPGIEPIVPREGRVQVVNP